MVNDFRNTYAFLDYKRMGVVMDFEACEVGGPRPERIMPDDGIGVFFNWNKVGFFKDRASALYRIDELISKAPAEAQKEFMPYEGIIKRSLK